MRSIDKTPFITILALAILICGSSGASGIVLAQQPTPVNDKNLTGKPAMKAGAIPEAWPANVQIERLSDIGRHKAVIFSPDFAQPGNREFYEKLGFLYIQDASWLKALNQIVARNYWHPEDRIDTIIIETHGTNGNGLKLQTGPTLRAARSYISVGALQEKLEGLGVHLCVIGACNSGRLFRPEIYKTLDPHPGDPLFLPATLGIINASREFDPGKSKMVVVRRAESEIETTSDGDTSELSPIARSVLGLRPRAPSGVARSVHFAVSNLLIQLLTHDPRLELTSNGFANEKSRNDLTEDESDELFQRLVAYIDDVATREYQVAHGDRPATSSQPSHMSPQPQAPGSRVPQPASTPDKRTSRRVIN
jgi:hypothetical protein